jgi:hypothetical protein
VSFRNGTEPKGDTCPPEKLAAISKRSAGLDWSELISSDGLLNASYARIQFHNRCLLGLVRVGSAFAGRKGSPKTLLRLSFTSVEMGLCRVLFCGLWSAEMSIRVPGEYTTTLHDAISMATIEGRRT